MIMHVHRLAHTHMHGRLSKLCKHAGMVIYQKWISISYTIYDFLQILVITSKEQIICTVNNEKKLEKKRRGTGEMRWEERQVGRKIVYI